MENNEYAQIIDNDPALAKSLQAPDDEYAQILNKDKEVQKQALQQSSYAASKGDADRKAEALQLAKEMKLPADIVERNLDEVKKQHEQKQFGDYTEIIDKTPGLAKWLQDPDNATLAKDDIDGLKKTEGLLKDQGFGGDLVDAFKYGAINMAASLAKSPALMAEQSPNAGMLGLYEDSYSQYQIYDQKKNYKVPEELYKNGLTRYLDEKAAKFAPKDIDANIIKEASDGNFQKAGRAFAFQVASNLPQLGLIVATRGAGLPLLGLSSASQKNVQNLEAGVAPDLARSNALATGAIETGIESIGGVGADTFRSSIKTMVKNLGPQSALQVIKESVKQIAKTGLEEGAEEWTTTVAQGLLDYGTGVGNVTLDGVASDAVNSFIVGAGSGVATHGITLGAEGTSQAMGRYSDYKKAESARDAYAQMGEVSVDSKLRKRSPEKHAEYLKEVTAGTPSENIYIPVEDAETYFQSKNINPVQFMQSVGAIDSYNEAKETGADIKIPFAEWTAKTIDTEHYQGLANDIKFQPEATTVNQSIREEQGVRDDLKRANDEAKAQIQAEAEAKKAESSQKIFESVRDQALAAGRNKIEADAVAKVFQNYYSTRAENRGLNEDPFDLYSGTNVQINKVEPDTSLMGRIVEGAKNLLGIKAPQVVQEKVFEQSANKPTPQITVPEGFFEDPKGKGDIELPALDPQDLALIGAEAKPVIIKENIAEKNQANHPEIPIGMDAEILKQALYNPDMVIQSKPNEKPNYWTFIKRDAKSNVSVIEISKSKDAYEVVNWYQAKPKHVEQIKRRAEREGGLFLITERSKSQGAAGLSALPFSSSTNIPGSGENGNGSYNQGAENAPRGRILFKAGYGAYIQLFGSHADVSTIIHEAGHLWFEERIDDATTEGVPQQLRDDMNATLKWLGLGVRVSDGADAIRASIKTEHHEQMARGLEAFLMEGKAPSAALRKIFAKFKIWLTGLYKNVENLNVPMDDKIRQVFSRMLVAESEVSRVEAQQNQEPLIKDPIAMGMTKDQAERYTEAIADAKAQAENAVRTKLLNDFRQQEEVFYKEKRAQVLEEVKQELGARREYRALSYLQKGTLPDGSPLPEGTTPLKISSESLKDMGAQATANLPRGISTKDGAHVEIVAGILDYGSGSDLVAALSGLPTLKEAARTETDKRMAELYPDSLVDGTISEEAVQAVHNDKRAQILRMEFEFLTKNIPALKDGIRRVARRLPTEKEVRAQAEKMIGANKVKEIRPVVYLRAEAKAAKEAVTLWTKGDFEAAAEAKRKELLNHELYRASIEATERVEKDRKKLKKLFKKDEDIAKTRDVDMVNAGRAILAQFGLASTDKTAEEYLAPIKAYDPETYESVMAIVQSASEEAGPYKTVSYDSFVAMSDAVQAIWDLAKSSREMEIDGLKIDREIITGELSQRLSELIPAGPMAGTGQALTDAEKRTLSLRSLKNIIMRVEHWGNSMDKGDINGVFTKYIVRPILSATTQYRLAKDSTIENLRDITKSLGKINPKEIIDAPEIGYKFTKPELIMALLHSGNESNLKKLLIGRGWGSLDPDGNLNLSKWEAFLLRAQQSGIITKNDMDVVQKIWDLNEKLKPDAQKAHKRMYGYYFNEITANEVRTMWGNYRGGYMPAIMDANISLDANIRAGQDIEESPAQMFPTTGKGFTKSRVENFTTPLSLDFGKIASHLDKVLRFTYIEPAVRDVARLVNDRGLRKDLNAFDSTIANELLIPWLKRAATQRSSTPGFNKTLDRGFSAFRRTSAIQFMVLNVQNMFQNLTATFPALVRVSGDHMAGAFKRYIKNPKETSKAIMEASPYMKTRAGSNIQDMMKDIDEVILNPSKFESFKDEAINKGYVLERATNAFMEFVVWDAAHNQALAKGLDAESAVREADATVRQTQAAMNPEDIARFESGTPFVKLFTMFSGFFNTQANLNLSEITKAKEEGFTSKEGSRRLARSYAFALAAPAIVSALIARVMGGAGLDEDDDGEYFDDILDLFFGSQVKYAMAMTPGGSVLSTAMNVFNDKPFDDKINVSPALSSLEKGLSSLKSVPNAISGNGSESKAIKEAFTALGLVSGLPLAPVAKPLSYVADVKSGKAEPSGAVDFSRGLVTGRPGGK